MELPGQRLRKIDPGWHTFVPRGVDDAAKWLLNEDRFSYLLHFALLKLAPFGTTADAEEAVQEFLRRSLTKLCQRHAPGKRSFLTYLLGALQYACWRQRAKLAKRASHEKPFPAGNADNQPSDILSAPDLFNRTELRGRMNRVGQELDARAWNSIQLHHFDGQSVDEIAQSLGESVANIKVLLCRGRHELGELLRWESCSLLRPAHVKDWPEFCQVLYAAANLDRTASVAGALWALLTSDVQGRIQLAASARTNPTADDTALIVAGLNQLLYGHGLWPGALLKSLRRQVAFPEEAARLLRKRHIGSISRLRVNRLILEFGLLGIIAISDPEATDYDASHE